MFLFKQSLYHLYHVYVIFLHISGVLQGGSEAVYSKYIPASAKRKLQPTTSFPGPSNTCNPVPTCHWAVNVSSEVSTNLTKSLVMRFNIPGKYLSWPKEIQLCSSELRLVQPACSMIACMIKIPLEKGAVLTADRAQPYKPLALVKVTQPHPNLRTSVLSTESVPQFTSTPAYRLL